MLRPKFRIGRAIELALAHDGAFLRRFLVARVKLNLVLVALIDASDTDDVLVLGDAEDGHALSIAAHDPDVADRGADHLALVGDEHELLAGMRREAGDDAAITLGRVDVRDALAASVGAAVLVSGRTLAVAVLGNGEDELFLLRHFGHALRGKRAFDVLAVTPWRA